MLAGGDDYELCFTVAEDNLPQVKTLAAEQNLTLSVIGRMEESASGKVLTMSGETFPYSPEPL